jgi:hypothetical protein
VTGWPVVCGLRLLAAGGLEPTDCWAQVMDALEEAIGAARTGTEPSVRLS